MSPSLAQGHGQAAHIQFFPYKKIWLQEIKTFFILTYNKQQVLMYRLKKIHQWIKKK